MIHQAGHLAERVQGTVSCIRTLTQNFPRFRLAPPCPAKSMFLWETEDISLSVNFCCLTCISIADSYISKMVAAHVVVGEEGCEKARTCRGPAQSCARLCKVLRADVKVL